MIDFLNYTLPIFYLLLIYTYGKAFFSDAPWAKRYKTPVLSGTISVHLIYLAARLLEYRRFPVTNIFEIFSVLALSIAVTYLIIEIHSRHKETGVFILSISFIFQVFSTFFIKDSQIVPEILKSPFFGLHVSSALIGYGGITIAGAYGLMYIMLYHEMKSTRFGVIYKKLPTLESLERMTVTAIKLVVALLGIAICLGIIWLSYLYKGEYYTDPKLIGTVVIWAMYGVLLIVRKYLNIQGRRIMIFSVAGFLISIFSMIIINIFFSEFHNFY